MQWSRRLGVGACLFLGSVLGVGAAGLDLGTSLVYQNFIIFGFEFCFFLTCIPETRPSKLRTRGPKHKSGQTRSATQLRAHGCAAEAKYCAWVQFWGPRSDSETGARTREANLVTRMGAQSSPTSDLNDWGRHYGSQNVEFLWLQNSARSAARKLVTLLLLALRKLPRKRSQKRSRKSYALLANPVPCSCPNVPAARLD